MALLAILRGILIIFTMIVYLLVYAITRIFIPHTKESAFKLRRHWIKNMCLPLLNIKTEVKGKPIDVPALYVSNHRSFIDPAIISKYLDAFVIAKAEVANYPIINKGAEVTGVIWVKRDDKDSRSTTRQAYVDTVKSGYNVLVFSEGTISTVKDPLPYKKGTFYEAAANKFPIVPIAIEYQDETDMWTVNSLFKQYIRQCSKWTIHTKLSFGKPLEGINGEELHVQAENWVKNEMTAMQIDWSKAFPK